ncbi:MAG: hypothetical protein ACQCN6_14605 [Candidatus Bathyarchaeia archaeon]
MKDVETAQEQQQQHNAAGTSIAQTAALKPSLASNPAPKPTAP